MSKPYLRLQSSETVVVQAASQIYAAYIAAGRVTEGTEDQWMNRSIKEAVRLAIQVDNDVASDGEMQ